MKEACRTVNFREGRLAAPSFAFAGRILGILILSLLAVSSFTGCSNEVKADQRLVETFVELRLVDIELGGTSSVARIARQNILKKYGYTREEYLTKIDKVLNDEHQWMPFQKAVNERIDFLLDDKKPAAASSSSRKKPPKTKKGVEE